MTACAQCSCADYKTCLFEELYEEGSVATKRYENARWWDVVMRR